MENKQRIPSWVGPTYVSRAQRYDCQRLVNYYLEQDEIGTGKGQEPAVMIATPGLLKLQTIGTGPIRCTYTQSNDQIMYVVSGNEVYQLSGALGSPLLLNGNLLTAAGPVQATDNGNQVMFVDGQYGYYLTIDATGTTASTPIFIGGGNGTISTITVDMGAVAETWILTATTSTDFTVVGSVSGAQADATVGTPYDNGFVGFTITQGSIVYFSGDEYIFNITSANTISQIVDPNFYPTDTISFQDGYFIGVQKGTQGFFISNLNDVTFPPLDEAFAQGSPDILIGAYSNNRQLYLLGAKSLETWWDQGASGSTPFVRQDGRFSQQGCVAPASYAVINETFFWLGSNAQGGGIVWMLDNGMPARVSTHAIELIIQNAGDLSSAVAFSYQQEGHYFYVLNIPGLNTTLVYDMDSGQWHERQDRINGQYQRHIAQTHCVLNGVHIIGDYQNGNLYKYDLDTYTNNGNRVPRIRQGPPLSENLNNVIIHLFTVDFQFGVGLVASSGPTTVGSDPKVWLEISKDGGQTFYFFDEASLGKEGQYRTRARWSMLGMSRDWVLRVVTDEPVKVQMLSGYSDEEVCEA